MSVLEEYRYELMRIGKEMQPRDWNEGASTIAEFADAVIVELEAENKELRRGIGVIVMTVGGQVTLSDEALRNDTEFEMYRDPSGFTTVVRARWAERGDE